MKQYETVIGLEVHVELATRTKIFCGCRTEFGAAPNTHVCPVCAGFPGSLPILNKKVVDFALRAGLALNCRIEKRCRFDRKNYFYPDNPQNYQISQLYLPICRDGFVEIETEGRTKRIGIHEIHMEEDAGKLIHDEWSGNSLVDYNRSGVPLIEIVSEPDMRSAGEVLAYLEKLQSVMRYLGVSDCRLQEGSMRADVNLSVREAGSERLGVRTEMKNLNSFKAIAHAIEGERERQIDLLSQGRPVIQETRRWDDNKESSYAMRFKEDARDYRYFPDPDLPSVYISDEWIEKAKREQPELREEKAKRYESEYGLSAYDAGLLTADPALARMFEETVSCSTAAKKAANWLTGETMRLLKEKEQEPSSLVFSAAHLAELIALVDASEISQKTAKEVFAVMFETDVDPKQYVKEHGLSMETDKELLDTVIRQVLSDNPKAVEELKSGKEKVLGFLTGQVMRAMKGKADAAGIKERIRNLCS